MTRTIKRLSSFVLGLMLLWLMVFNASAATPLPQSTWYAVTWVEATDTLHWVNAAGEQASIARPKLAGEISQAQTRLHMSPNGRYLVVISPLNTGREGIGFYDIEAGQFVQTHEAQPNEVFLPAGQYPFTEFSGHFAIPLRDNVTGAWRMLVFEAATGNALHQLTWNDPTLPQGVINNADFWPRIAQFNFDEALNGLQVRFHIVTHSYIDQQAPPSYAWYIPPVDPYSVNPDDLTYSQQAGFDINRMTGERVYAWFNQQFGAPDTPGAANTITMASGDNNQVIASADVGSARLPRWLNNGNWIGYYGHNGAFAPHWMVITNDSQTLLNLSPEIIDVYHVNDGFLTKNTTAWRLNYVNDLNAEAFTEPGMTIFQPNSAFAIIYTTPTSSMFNLPSIGTPSIDDIQAPETCADVLPPRLVIGQSARVAYTDGTNLNFRTAPGEAILMQIPEGSVMEVLAGPNCVDGYQWWQLEMNDGTIGWAAESVSDEYFLEPFTEIGNVQIVPTATNPPRAGVNPPRAVTPTNPPRAGVNPPRAQSCDLSPTSRLQVGSAAQVIVTDGTLAVYETVETEYPYAQLPTNTIVNVIDSPTCRNDILVWYITTQINGQTIQGWVAEGYGNAYYLQPSG